MSVFRALIALTLGPMAVPVVAALVAAPAEVEDNLRIGREEIARILAADNVDANVMTSREVVATIRAIPRGQAPDDFWSAYQAHLRAWEVAAAAEETAGKIRVEDVAAGEAALAALIEAETAIATSFAEVQRIAESYGVAMPEPPVTAASENAI